MSSHQRDHAYLHTSKVNLSECLGSEAKCFEGAYNSFLMFVLCEGMIVKVSQRKKNTEKVRKKIGN